jgi:hypothetical protein
MNGYVLLQPGGGERHSVGAGSTTTRPAALCLEPEPADLDRRVHDAP